VGDRGRLSDEICECGKGLPLIDRIDGRCDDVLLTADGRRVGRLDPVFKDNLPIREAQIIQESLGEIRVKYATADDFSNAALAKLAGRIRERMGDVRVEFEEVNAIPRTSRGKFRAVICNIDAEERARLGLL
jgi:phenylacetate-CoA ligase